MNNQAIHSDHWSTLPNRVFISHAYEDSAIKDDLLHRLPAYVQPIVFPRRDPNPKEAVSNGIVAEIRSCFGLIYLAGGHSKDSLWVNFERDYALRSGLKVFAFDAEARLLRDDMTPVAPLRAEVVIGEDREHRADRLLEWLRSERSFDFKKEPTYLKMKEVPDFVAGLIHDQSIVMWFMDDYVGGLARIALEIPAETLQEAYNSTFQTFHCDSAFNGYEFWLSEQSMYVRLKPEWQQAHSEDSDVQELILGEYPIENAFHRGWAVDLVSQADESEIDWNRADDLIVRTTFMIQHPHPFLMGENEATGLL